MQFHGLLSDILSRAGDIGLGGQDPVLAGAIRTLARMQAHAFGQWAAVARAGVRCQVCGTPAVGACVGCERIVCQDHAMVSVVDGAALCHECVSVAIAAGRSKAKSPRAEPEAPPATPPPSPRWTPPGAQSSGPARQPAPPTDEQLRRQHMRTLGLDFPLSARKINAVYRKLAARYHPDRCKVEAQKKRAQETFIAIGAAKDWLLAHLED